MQLTSRTATNNEFGFDYLRDNMAFTSEERVQRSLDYAIVDEVDSILIDEARTPLIISGQAAQSTDLYLKIDQLAPKLVRQDKIETGLPAVLAGGQPEVEETGDFFVDEKNRQVELTERGHELVENELKRLGLLDPNDSPLCGGESRPPASRSRGLEGALPVPARRPLHGARRRDRHRRRTYRARHGWPPLVRRHPPGGRSQGSGCRFATKRKRSPPPRCKTTSGYTTSWPA